MVIYICVLLCHQRLFKAFPSNLLDPVVRNVHQLVPLPGHSPDISPEQDVLHREDAQVLDLQVK